MDFVHEQYHLKINQLFITEPDLGTQLLSDAEGQVFAHLVVKPGGQNVESKSLKKPQTPQDLTTYYIVLAQLPWYCHDLLIITSEKKTMGPQIYLGSTLMCTDTVHWYLAHEPWSGRWKVFSYVAIRIMGANLLQVKWTIKIQSCTTTKKQHQPTAFFKTNTPNTFGRTRLFWHDLQLEKWNS